MAYLIIYSLIFILGGTLGYFIELVFRRIVHKKWINPGFLTGPCLPLYGVGTVCLFFISSFNYSFIASPVWRAVFVIAIITFAMTFVEYITGLIFIKGMNVKLWDYSDRWGNIQGIICPLFTLFWGIIGAVYYLFLHKFFVDAALWLGENPWFSFGVGLAFKLSAAKKAQEIKEKFNFFFGLHNKKDLNGDLDNYFNDEKKNVKAKNG